MRKTLSEIATIIDGEVLGNGQVVITGLRGIKDAGDGDITFVDNPKYISLIEKTRASAIVVSSELKVSGKTFLKVQNPSLAFAKIAALYLEKVPSPKPGIHPSAIIGEDVHLGKNVSIGPCVVIEDRVSIDDQCVIYPGSYIGYKTSLGKNCIIYPNVTVREHISIGSNVIIHSGTVIGSDGFGYATVKGVHEKIPQIGTVVIEDDVEIGANVTIDRARFDKTIIGQGTKIDNLVQIAHNVILGKHCLIISQVGISGSVTIEDHAVLAGQAGIAGHLTIGEGAIVAAQAGVSKTIPPKTMVSGYPARPFHETQKVNACVQRLPEYVKTIQELKRKVEELEKKIHFFENK